jgi:predicted O-linked N-acetylglucosamine transferase (SPINDLY family)
MESYRAGRPDEAAAACRAMLEREPKNINALQLLAAASAQSGATAQAIEALELAVEAAPDTPQLHYNLAEALRTAARNDDAEVSYRNAIKLDADHVPALQNLATLLLEAHRIDEAVALLQRAVRVAPDCAPAHYFLGLAMFYLDRAADAIAWFERTLELDPAHLHSALLMYLNYTQGNEGPAMFAEHRGWAQLHADRYRPAAPPPVHGHRARKLRIGYLSADFFGHAVARLAEPLLKYHDRTRFEITCYSDVSHGDAVTRRFVGYADTWRDITGLSDEQAAELIRRDGIDVLIDMAGHTGVRLRMLARQPAPVQITHFGYPNTTGLRTMQWRVSDFIADPPGMTEPFYSEKILRLDGCAWCYQPDETPPDPGAVPADTTGHITFGSFNNAVKVTPSVIELWAQLLRASPGARIVMLSASPSYDNRERIAAEFAHHGITADRLTLLPRMPRAQYLAQHQQVDICLDTFPYTGGVTTLDALWMGMPVVTLAGTTHVTRVGASMLHHIGLGELISTTREQYVQIASALKGDLNRLRTLRSELRQRMRATLADGLAYARRFEEAVLRGLEPV